MIREQRLKNIQVLSHNCAECFYQCFRYNNYFVTRPLLTNRDTFSRTIVRYAKTYRVSSQVYFSKRVVFPTHRALIDFHYFARFDDYLPPACSIYLTKSIFLRYIVGTSADLYTCSDKTDMFLYFSTRTSTAGKTSDVLASALSIHVTSQCTRYKFLSNLIKSFRHSSPRDRNSTVTCTSFCIKPEQRCNLRWL